MREEISVRIAGEAGQGMQTIGIALCKIFKNAGLNIFANQDVMSRIRGGNNYFQLRVSKKPLYSLRGLVEIIIALDKPSIEIHKKNISKDGIIIVDKKKYGINDNDTFYFDVPFYDMAKTIGGSELFINSVACGILAGIIRIELNYVSDVLRIIFKNKTEDIIKQNLDAAKAGYDFAINIFKNDIFTIKEGKVENNYIMNGHDAIALGAVRAGCKFYSAYPMSPSTSILNSIADYSKKYNIVVEQAEDEIAAVNMIIGASYAGVRSMAGTSGGGFCLMVEGISLSGMTETPIVVVDAQRPAPATGFPTRTEQADLDFLIHAGHGEFAKAIFAPGTAEQAFYLTVKAFNLAEKYQIPVLIMSDQHLAESYRNIGMFDLNKAKVARYIISKEESKKITNYKRYQLNDTGISPFAVPSWIEDVIYADSDEHTEDGHITEDAEVRKNMVQKRFYKKMLGLSKEIEKPESYNINDAEMLLVGFGSTYGVMRETCDLMKDSIKIGFIHLPQVWPFPKDEISRLLKDTKNVITVENNAGAQLAKLILRETGIAISKSILKYDGRPFDIDYLKDSIESL